MPQTGGSCWQSLPWVMWMGWTQAGSRQCRAGAAAPTFQQIFLLLPVQNLILSASPCSLVRKFLASVSSKLPLHCGLCLTLLAWGFGEKWGKFPFSRNKLQYLQRIGSTGMLLSLNLRNVLGSATGVPGWCKVCALGSRIPLLLAILGIYSMSGLSEFVEVHIFFFFFSKVNFKMKKIYTI